jgi:hypothetical protein
MLKEKVLYNKENKCLLGLTDMMISDFGVDDPKSHPPFVYQMYGLGVSWWRGKNRENVIYTGNYHYLFTEDRYD